VVSHGVSAMVIQAAAAEQVLGQDPQEARRALGRVQQTGRDAIAELHRLLGVLRPDEEQTALAPAPGVYAIAGLVEESRAAGHDVRLEVIGETNELPTALQLSAYRIVQESLTNARKYAPESPVWVRLDAGAGGLEIDVVDSGGGHAPSSGGGRGLRGLQERAAAFGGTVEAGSSGTGFAVRARLPLGTAP
jgi:signal transduction histidine kinase